MRLHLHRPRRIGLFLTATTLMVLTALIGGAVLREAAAAPRERFRDRPGVCAPAARIALGLESRLDARLSDLVADGTLTRDQADAVVASLTNPDAIAPIATDSTPTSTADSDRTRRQIAAARAERCAAAAQNAQATVQAVSDLLALDPPEVADRLAAGESLAEIAESEGVSRSDLISALQTGVTARLDAAEAAGSLTPEDRATREAATLTRIETLIDRHRGDRLPETDATPPTT